MVDLAVIPTSQWIEAQRRAEVVRPLVERSRCPRRGARAWNIRAPGLCTGAPHEGSWRNPQCAAAERGPRRSRPGAVGTFGRRTNGADHRGCVSDLAEAQRRRGHSRGATAVCLCRNCRPHLRIRFVAASRRSRHQHGKSAASRFLPDSRFRAQRQCRPDRSI